MHSEHVDTREKNTRNTRDTKKGPELRIREEGNVLLEDLQLVRSIYSVLYTYHIHVVALFDSYYDILRFIPCLFDSKL